MPCAKSVTVTFSGITFDGTPYGIPDDVNQSFIISKDAQNSTPQYCDYHNISSPRPDTPYLSVSIAIRPTLNEVFYHLYYRDANGGFTGVSILDGTAPMLVVPNSNSNGGVATIVKN
jgi:hypothetical protein